LESFVTNMHNRVKKLCREHLAEQVHWIMDAGQYVR
jgi:hypothetical protein